MKQVLLVTQYFYPETFKGNDIAFDLVKRGYSVDVLTGIPNYPEGKYYKSYGLFKNRIQIINGVRVYRAFLFPRGKGRGFSLALNYFSFVFCAIFWALFLSLRKKYDCIIVQGLSPITQGLPAILVKRLQKIPIYFWVLDLWPESLEFAGGVKNKSILHFFERIVRYVYNSSDKILISSKSFEKSILRKGDYESKLIYFPNWGEDVFSLSKLFPVDFPNGFKIVFAGNMGEAQDLESVLKVAKAMKKDMFVKWIFVGDGRKKIWVEKFIKENQLEETVYLMGRHPLEMMPSFFACADAMLISLKNEFIFNLTVPAKLQAYMAAGRPILGMLNGEGATIIKDAKCGYVVNAGDVIHLQKIIKEQILVNRNEFELLGRNGQLYYQENFNKEKCIDHLCEIIN